MLVGDGQSLALVVRDQDGAELEIQDQLADPEPGLLAQLGVEVRQRLIEQKDRAARRRGARQIATRCCWPPDSWSG